MPDNNIYSNFFKNKSVQRTDKFLLTIVPELFAVKITPRQQQYLDAMNARSGPMPKVEGHHVVNVTAPTWEFKKETSGWNSFPSLNLEGGFEFAVMLEEDRHGTIGKFINWLQRRLVDDSGYHFPSHLNRIGRIIIEVFNDQDVPIYAHEYRNCYFLRATPATYDYTTSTSQKLSITFGTEDHIFYENDKDLIDNEKENESFTQQILNIFS